MKRNPGETEFVPVEDDDNAAPSAFLIDSMWEQIDIYLNDQRCTTDQGFRYLSSYLAKRLFFSKECHTTYMSPEVSWPDDSIDVDSTNWELNKGFQYRQTLFKKVFFMFVVEIQI